MSEMIERVAKVIARQVTNEYDWLDFVEVAKAAIEAMREPTLAIRAAMYQCEDGSRRVDDAWSYLIDAALKE